ncbi:hypothetical protein ACQY0O_003936 [Thecaphora frezii]
MSTSSPPSSSDASTAGATPALEKQLALSAAPTMTPLLSATQRLQLLYALTTGDAAPTSTASCSAPKSEDRDRDSVLRRLASLQSQLLQVVSSDRGLKRFINDWSKNSSLLGLGYNPPSVNALTIPYDAQLALCLEMEPDLSRSLAQLEEIQQLEARNVLDSKSLARTFPLVLHPRCHGQIRGAIAMSRSSLRLPSSSLCYVWWTECRMRDARPPSPRPGTSGRGDAKSVPAAPGPHLADCGAVPHLYRYSIAALYRPR